MSLPLKSGIDRLYPCSQSVNHRDYDLPRKLEYKFGHIIVRISEVISENIQKRKENNLNSPEVRENIAIELAKGLIREREENPRIRTREWGLIAEMIMENNQDLRKKTEKNKNSVLHRMFDLIESDYLRKHVDMEAKFESEKPDTDSNYIKNISSSLNMKKKLFKIDLCMLKDVTAASSAIVRLWLVEEALNPGISFDEYTGMWKKYFLNRENTIKNTEKNINEILELSKGLLFRYYRNMEIEELKKEVSREMEGYVKALLGSREPVGDLPEGFGRFKDPDLRKKYEDAKKRLADLISEQMELDPLILAGLKP